MLTRAHAHAHIKLHPHVRLLLSILYSTCSSPLVLHVGHPGSLSSLFLLILSECLLHSFEPDASLEAQHADAVHSEECDCDKE